MHKTLSRACAAALLTLLLAPAVNAQAKIKLGILSWNDKEPRYITTKNAALAELERAGFGKDKIEVIVADAEGKKDKVPDLINQLKAKGVDVYFTLGTSAAVPVAKAVTDKPVTYGMVYDPISANIIADWSSSGNNVTGGSNFISIPAFMRRLVKRSEGYNIKKIAVVLTPGEKNSELQAAAVKSVEQELGVKVDYIPLMKNEDVPGLAKKLKGYDAMYVTGSNIVGTNIAAVIAASIKNKVLSCTHLEDLVERGVLFGLVADAEEVGKLAGGVIAKVMGGAEPSKVPSVYPTPRLIINEKTAKDGGFKIPPAIQQWAAGAVEKKS